VSVNFSDREIKHMRKLRGIIAGAAVLIGLGGCYPPTQPQISPTVVEQPQPLHFGATTASEQMPQIYMGFRNPDGSYDTYGPNGQMYMGFRNPDGSQDTYGPNGALLEDE
jgi:hypothetical protein